MSHNFEKIDENVPGLYYVNKSCIGCRLCNEIASENIQENIYEGYSYICKQPQSEQEEMLCQEAMDLCPTHAIQMEDINQKEI